MRPRSLRVHRDAPVVAARNPRRPIPHGYRQGIITAITIFIGFSLAFLRYWAFEAEGAWTLRALVVTIALIVAIALEIFVLFRALRVADDDEREYAKTVAWFVTSAVVLLVGLSFAALDMSIE